MKYRLITLLVLLPFISFAQERGVGIRLGEPLSITYKDFLTEYISIEGMIGSAGINGGSYYQKDFESNLPESNAFMFPTMQKREYPLTCDPPTMRI